MEKKQYKKSVYDREYEKEHLEQVNIRIRKEEKTALQEEAKNKGLSMRQYVIDAINAKAGKVIISTRESRRKREKRRDKGKKENKGKGKKAFLHYIGRKREGKGREGDENNTI